MPIRKDSPVTKFGGFIIMPDYMTYISLGKWETALAKARALGETGTIGQFYTELLPAALDIVLEWHLTGLKDDKPVSLDNFPANAKLTAWVIECVTELYSLTNSSDPN